MTMIILFLAANTAFNGFPVLGSILARDGFLPRALHTRGDRLAYSNGILMLAAAAIALVLIYNASVTALIQLYVVGVFVSFTVSQFGMMRHWTRHLKTEKDPKVRATMMRSRVINAIGLTGTGVVLLIVLAAKFIYGAYLAVIAMAAVFLLMRGIRNHYDKVARETAVGPMDAAAAAQPGARGDHGAGGQQADHAGRELRPGHPRQQHRGGHRLHRRRGDQGDRRELGRPGAARCR